MHPLTYFSIHLFIPGHQAIRLAVSIVQSLPACADVGLSCMSLRRSHRVSLFGGTTIFLSLDQSLMDSSMADCRNSSWYCCCQSSINSFCRSCSCWICCLMDVHAGSGSSASRMNILSGRSMTSVLSSSPWSTPGGLDSMSAAAWIFPGTCFMMRL